MTGSAERLIVVCGIIERGDRSVLICRVDSTDGGHLWEFPSGIARGGESPEEAMRRAAVETVGLTIDIQVGQPPFDGHYRGREAAFRYFLAGVFSGEGERIAYPEIRWIPPGALREYMFDPPTQRVVDWYLTPQT